MDDAGYHWLVVDMPVSDVMRTRCHIFARSGDTFIMSAKTHIESKSEVTREMRRLVDEEREDGETYHGDPNLNNQANLSR